MASGRRSTSSQRSCLASGRSRAATQHGRKLPRSRTRMVSATAAQASSVRRTRHWSRPCRRQRVAMVRRCLRLAQTSGSHRMIRFLFSLAAILLALPAAPAAPRAQDRPATYFPTRVGDRWVYDDGKEKESVREVTAVEVKREETIVTVSEPGRKAVAERVSVSAAGVRRLEFNGFTLDGYWLIKLPAKEGDKWEFDYPNQRDGQGRGLRGEKGTVTVGPTEEVEVPAGKFRAVRLEIEVTAINGKAGPEIRYTSLYAPEVGLVKMTRGSEWTRVLKSFTPGK